MKKILVSACLLGRPVRYDGASKSLTSDLLEAWRREGRLVSVCPELDAGLPVPRPPAEIADGNSGETVLDGRARIIEDCGRDVTDVFLDGAAKALETARNEGCGYALLTDGSPSCGSSFVYDGSFNGTRRRGAGVTAALLKRNGIEVYSESRIEDLAQRLADEAD